MGLGALLRSLTSAQAAHFKTGQRSPSGRWLVVQPPSATASLRAVHRADLSRELADALEPGTVRFSNDAVIAPGGDPAITVNGRVEDFDLVIAADGISGASRSTLGLDPGLHYAGYTAWRGVTAEPCNLFGEAGETWGVANGSACSGHGAVGQVGSPLAASVRHGSGRLSRLCR